LTARATPPRRAEHETKYNPPDDGDHPPNKITPNTTSTAALFDAGPHVTRLAFSTTTKTPHPTIATIADTTRANIAPMPTNKKKHKRLLLACAVCVLVSSTALPGVLSSLCPHSPSQSTTAL
jgi:hypothetical protein